MPMKKIRSEGFSLIEILIALVVLLVGLLGILALYPVGIQNTNQAAQDSTVGKIASNVKELLTVAMREAPPGGPVKATLPGVQGGLLTFNLPQASTDSSPATWCAYPSSNKQLPPGGSGTGTILGSDCPDSPGTNTGSRAGQVYDYCANANDFSTQYIKFIQEGKINKQNLDKTEPTCQYSYAFDIRRPGPESLYEFRLMIYRAFDQKPVGKAGDDAINNTMQTFHFLLAGNGG